MSLDLTGKPFSEYGKELPAPCEMCIRFPLGGFDWNCDRCKARKFVRETPAEQEYTRRLWQESMPADEFERMQALVADEFKREQERRRVMEQQRRTKGRRAA